MVAALSRAFSGRAVFVTGHTGFKGSWLALWLKHLGARVYGYALQPPSEPNNFAVSGVREILTEHWHGDVRDGLKLENALRTAAPDVVFHLAAQALVRESYVTPRETFDVNVLGTASVLEAVRVLKRPCVVVVVTSDKCYENREQPVGYQEADALGGHDPYSASKGAAEIVTAAYRRSFFHPELLDRHGVKMASARAGNVIGGGDWAKDRIVTDMVTALAAGQPVPVRSPWAVRPWQHVL
jgi:CDP-glucose 4,6-dehydratase